MMSSPFILAVCAEMQFTDLPLIGPCAPHRWIRSERLDLGFVPTWRRSRRPRSPSSP